MFGRSSRHSQALCLLAASCKTTSRQAKKKQPKHRMHLTAGQCAGWHHWQLLRPTSQQQKNFSFAAGAVLRWQAAPTPPTPPTPIPAQHPYALP